MPFLLALACAIPSATHAGEANWCVDPDGGALPACCKQAENSTPFTNLSEAFEAARTSPDAPFERSLFCVGTDSTAAFDILLDTSIGAFARSVEVQFEDFTSPNWCPESDGVRFTNPTDDDVRLTITGLHFDGDACPTWAPGLPLVETLGGDLEIVDARILGLSGPFLEFSSTGQESVELDVRTTRVEGGVGPVFVGGGELRVDRCEISARTADSPLVDIGPAGLLDLGATLWFGNAVNGGNPMIRSGSVVRTNYTTFAANEVSDLGSILEVDATTAADPLALAIFDSTFSDNRARGENPPQGASIVPRPVNSSDPIATLCLPRGSDGLSPRDRPRPAEPSAPGTADLVRVLGLPTAAGFVLVQKSYFVGNDLNEDSALIALGGTTPRRVTFLHNTIDETAAATIRATTDVPDSQLISARNLLLGIPRLELGPDWGLLETTMEMVEGDPATWLDGAGAAPGLRGPFPPEFFAGPAGLLLGDATVGMSHCARALAHCPGRTEADCTNGVFLDGVAQCGLDEAAAYLPSPEGLASAAHRWPWSSAGFPQWPAGVSQNFAGATGWECTYPFTGELSDTGGEDGPYDGDGATGLVDCNNTDAGVIPEVPEADGFGDRECTETTCYECPEEDTGDDDDDSASPSAAVFACLRTGCGTPLIFAALVPLAVPLRRQRR